MKKIILTLVFCLTLFGCKEAPKQQKVIFDVSTVSCRGDSMCNAYIAMAQSECLKMTTSLSSSMADGWRVVASTKKERLAPNFSPAMCEGTEYILEK